LLSEKNPAQKPLSLILFSRLRRDSKKRGYLHAAPSKDGILC
jgi:hypothetical protein